MNKKRGSVPPPVVPVRGGSRDIGPDCFYGAAFHEWPAPGCRRNTGHINESSLKIVLTLAFSLSL